jgi:hypothetical protein
MVEWQDRCKKYPGIVFGEALRKARKRSQKRRVPFNIDKDYLIDLFEKQNGRCYYSGLNLNMVKEDRLINDPMKMSLDCIDPDRGYTIGNVVWCAYCVNVFKQKMSVNQMIDICGGIIKTSAVGRS